MLSRVTDAVYQSYTVNMPYSPEDDLHGFLGWKVNAGNANIHEDDYEADTTYANGSVIFIKGNVTFSVNSPQGNWFVFDENGKGATFNAPKFLKTNDVTAKPRADEDMKRRK